MINHIITSTLLLLFLLLLSVCLEKRIDPRLKYALWLLAVVKLLIPLPAFETPMSILNLVNPATLERDSTDQRPDARSDTAAADPSLKQEAPDQQASSQKTLNQNTLDQQTGYEKTAAQKASFQRIPAIPVRSSPRCGSSAACCAAGSFCGALSVCADGCGMAEF